MYSSLERDDDPVDKNEDHNTMVAVLSVFVTTITTDSRQHGCQHRAAIHHEQQNEMWRKVYRA